MEVDGTPRILVAAGPGSFARLGEAKLSLAKVDVVLLAHLHIDHAGELPGLFKARAVSSNEPVRFRVFGPDGRKGSGADASFPSTTRFVDLLFGQDGAFGYLRNFSAPMTQLGGQRDRRSPTRCPRGDLPHRPRRQEHHVQRLPEVHDMSLEQMRRLGVYFSEPSSPQETDRPLPRTRGPRNQS